jgi:RNA recognition motif-containing protein
MPKRSSVSPERSRGGKRRKSLSNDASCTVFVGNLKYETRWQALKDHMRGAGNVDSVSCSLIAE